jgi:uncharacterized protein (TIGR02453 family)
MSISKSTISFLKQLAIHNDRDWFAENKSLYTDAQENAIFFADSVLEKMNKFDKIETPSGKKALKRIYRDVRFSKNKAPYKQHFGIMYARATAARRGGYYLHIQPGESFIGGGFWGPEKDDLLLVRKHIAQDDSYLREVLNNKKFKTTFGEMRGEQLKSAPKGFDKEHFAIDLLRYKQYLVMKRFTDEEVLSANFDQLVADTFKGMQPFMEIMTEMLTTNLNGESLID